MRQRSKALDLQRAGLKRQVSAIQGRERFFYLALLLVTCRNEFGERHGRVSAPGIFGHGGRSRMNLHSPGTSFVGIDILLLFGRLLRQAGGLDQHDRVGGRRAVELERPAVHLGEVVHAEGAVGGQLAAREAVARPRVVRAAPEARRRHLGVGRDGALGQRDAAGGHAAGQVAVPFRGGGGLGGGELVAGQRGEHRAGGAAGHGVGRHVPGGAHHDEPGGVGGHVVVVLGLGLLRQAGRSRFIILGIVVCFAIRSSRRS